jgi:hypothetical protein
MNLPDESTLRLIAAFILGFTSGLLLAVYLNVYRIWGTFVRFIYRRKKPPPQRIITKDLPNQREE